VVANGVAEATWLRQLLQELHKPLISACLVYCDNVSAIYLSTNPVQRQRTKHVEIDLHFVREGGNGSPSGLFVFFTSPPRRSSPMFSPRASIFCVHRFSLQPECLFHRRSDWGVLELITFLL
jgi:hypothetical protein